MRRHEKTKERPLFQENRIRSGTLFWCMVCISTMYRMPKNRTAVQSLCGQGNRPKQQENGTDGFRKKYRKVEITVKVKPSVKKICEKCKIIKRHGHVMVICENPKHKQRQG